MYYLNVCLMYCMYYYLNVLFKRKNRRKQKVFLLYNFSRSRDFLVGLLQNDNCILASVLINIVISNFTV